MLLELSRLGSMREVADQLGVTTSTVSQQLAALGREVRATLLEPDGRRVRLTPAGRRLAGHAVTILAAVEAARADLDPEADPHGQVRVASFASAARRHLIPMVSRLADVASGVTLLIYEHEPVEALDLLARDGVDLAIVYDYNLAPRRLPASVRSRPLDRIRWGLGVPAGTDSTGSAREIFDRLRDEDWIVNSRNTADDEAIHAVAALAGFTPRVTHRSDSLELVQDMIAEGLGVGMLPEAMPTRPGVEIATLADPEVELRSFALTRGGREQWPPMAVVLRLLEEATGQ